MTFESGGQGLWSTAEDYLTFARLFVERGSVNGVPVLRPETLALMTSNQLTPDQRARAQMSVKPFCRRAWIRNGRRRRDEPRIGGSDPGPRRRRHRRLAGGIRRLVAGQSW